MAICPCETMEAAAGNLLISAGFTHMISRELIPRFDCVSASVHLRRIDLSHPPLNEDGDGIDMRRLTAGLIVFALVIEICA